MMKECPMPRESNYKRLMTMEKNNALAVKKCSWNTATFGEDLHDQKIQD
jgi:hypothetical protein